MNIFELMREYARERALSDASATHYRFVAHIFVRDSGVHRTGEVTREALLRWRERTLARNVSNSTWNNYLRHMRALCSFAAGRGLMPEEAPGSLSGLLMRANVERPKIVTDRELRKVMAFLQDERTSVQPGWYWAVLLRTLFFTGMRRRQLTELKWGDVDLERATIELRAESSKNRRGWQIPIVAKLLPSLELLRERTVSVLGEDAQLDKRYVFDISLFSSHYRSCREGRMNSRAVSNFFSRVRFATGVSISAHKLRHTMATKLARLGLYKELQCLLGHTDMKMTMRYVHPEIEHLRSLAEHLDSIDAD